MNRLARVSLPLLLLAATAAAPPPIVELSIDELGAMMADGRATSAGLVAAYLKRIEAMDRKGPALHAMIATSPDALYQAKASDERRKAGATLGPLDGVPILVKDNIETKEPIATTAGSLALLGNVTGRDAPVVAALRAKGAVILGKTNLSEWANIRSTRSMSGWSAVGGLVKNPYVLDRSACGSSSGSGASVAASYAAAALGTETDGSVICPASLNGLVGLKPTIGLVSRTRVVPISHSQDTPGPMARSVRDVALLFTAMVAADPEDAATKDAGAHVRDYAAGLSPDALKGVRIAVLRPEMDQMLAVRFETALSTLARAGAILVAVAAPKLDGLGKAELDVLKMELKSDLDAYLATAAPAVTARSLDQLIAYNRAQAAAEMPWFGQELFEAAARTRGVADPGYRPARATSLKLAGDAIEAMLKAANATLIVQPSSGPAWLSDPVHGDQYDGPSASRLPAVAGYPHLTVPMGLVQGLPVGLSLIGPRYSEAALLGAGHAYEQASHARAVPTYKATIDVYTR